MGAENFSVRAKGKSVMDAFESARDQAAYDHGHGGYTGTIAEKHSFELKQPPAGVDPVYWADDYDLPPYSDKWGPAWAVQLAENEWLFFGSASS